MASSRKCELTLIVGEAGVGKSRLAAEFIERLPAETTVASGRCRPYGEGITFWPIAEVVRQLAEIDDGDPIEAAFNKLHAVLAADDQRAAVAERIAAAVGFSDRETYPEEIFWAVRRLLEAVARKHPMVLIFDDFQWAEDAFCRLIEYVARESVGNPIMMLGLARPELREIRPALVGDTAHHVTSLEPLDTVEARQLVTGILGEADVRPRSSLASPLGPPATSSPTNC